MSVAVAVVLASKDEEETDELLLILILAQAPDRTGRLFMSPRLHGLIVAFLLAAVRQRHVCRLHQPGGVIVLCHGG